MSFTLKHVFGDVIHVGSEHECKLILKAFETVGHGVNRFEVIPPIKYLSDRVKNQLIDYLEVERRSTMFGDGTEYDYINDGVTILGLSEMSDDELIEEFESYGGESYKEELYKEAIAEREIHTILK